MTLEEKLSKIIRLAELAKAATDERILRQYLNQINIISAIY
jgi:hypothetical protein